MFTSASPSNMKFGCSECLCIAIESHRPALLKSLLQRSDVVYRDMFWAPYPHNWSAYSSVESSVTSIPQLHHFGSDSDLSFVGREDCAHMRVDVELQTPFDELCRPNYSTAYILVSLPLMARWHSSVAFNAEHILRQSGQFHCSEPQFYHWQRAPSVKLPGPLVNSTSTWLQCEFESDCEALTFDSNSGTPPLVLHQKSSLPCDKIFFHCLFNYTANSGIFKFYGKLSRLINELFTREFVGLELHFGKQIQRQLRAVLESGADLNLMLPYRYCQWSSISRVRAQRFIKVYDVLVVMILQATYDSFIWTILQNVLKFLLHNGLSFFYSKFINTSDTAFQVKKLSISDSLLHLLFLKKYWPLPLLPLVRAIALQLLALGYGRRELHTGSFRASDANLFVTRLLLTHSHEESKLEARRELQILIDHFDSGPLTLQQLARIAVRRAVGGADFARQVRRISSHMPPLLFEYVAEPSEYLLTDDEVDLLQKASAH